VLNNLLLKKLFTSI